MAGMWFVVCVPKDEEIAKPKQPLPQQQHQTLQAPNGAVRKDANGVQETRTSAKQVSAHVRTPGSKLNGMVQR
ncbi:hypothetical protein MRX96_004196 [Rhipicephalus microplus]